MSKTKHAVAIADGGRGGEVRFLRDVASSPAAVERLIGKLAARYGKLHFCDEAVFVSMTPSKPAPGYSVICPLPYGPPSAS